MEAGETARLRNLCRLFSVSPASTEYNPAAAFSILSTLYSMPAVEKHDERRRYGNDILQTARGYFGPTDGPEAAQFFGKVSSLVIEIQEFPDWFRDFAASAEELVRKYKTLAWVTFGLKVIGIGAGASASAAGFAEALKSGRIKPGVQTTLGRLAGRGAIFEAIAKRWEQAALLTPAIFVIVVAASAVYAAMLEEMGRIKMVIMDKFQRGEVSRELFNQVFTEVDADDIKKYWEMK
jgi:hypothetical protein